MYSTSIDCPDAVPCVWRRRVGHGRAMYAPGHERLHGKERVCARRGVQTKRTCLRRA